MYRLIKEPCKGLRELQVMGFIEIFEDDVVQLRNGKNRISVRCCPCCDKQITDFSMPIGNCLVENRWD
jgi:hypothetical protein